MGKSFVDSGIGMDLDETQPPSPANVCQTPKSSLSGSSISSGDLPTSQVRLPPLIPTSSKGLAHLAPHHPHHTSLAASLAEYQISKGPNPPQSFPFPPPTPPHTPTYSPYASTYPPPQIEPRPKLLTPVSNPSTQPPSPPPSAQSQPSNAPTSLRSLGAKVLLPAFMSQYEMLDELGSGGFGFVVRAFRRKDGLTVAVKFIIRQKIPSHGWVKVRGWSSKDEKERLVPMEAYVLRMVKHEGIVGFIDLFEDDTYFYLVGRFSAFLSANTFV